MSWRFRRVIWMRALRVGVIAMSGVACVQSAPLLSQERVSTQLGSSTENPSVGHQPGTPVSGVESLTWRNIGPTRVGGHITDIAVADYGALGSHRDSTVTYAAGVGGLFRSVDGGVTWIPVFDGTPIAAVNAVAVAPSDPNVVWAGTGFPDTPMLGPVIGRGVFRSRDGGEHWVGVGLAETDYIGRIVVDPRDANVAYVGAIGSLTHPSHDRGVYKTVDGGAHWQQVLFVNAWTGIVDLISDPSNPDILYAAAEQRARNGVALLDYGPGSGLYKSTDGGRTWRKLTHGLPAGLLGRCGLAISTAAPATVYAVVAVGADTDSTHPISQPREVKRVAVYRSDDRGETWRRMGQPPTVGYRDDFGRIVADPTNPDRIYVGGQGLDVSSDGGQTFRTLTGPFGQGLADQHAMWIDPHDPKHLIVGNDRGIWISEHRGESWRHVETLALAQYFSVAADRRTPFYHIYGSMRDHPGYDGPSQTRDAIGIPNSAWLPTPAIENFGTAIDTIDNTTLYVGGNQALVRYDRIEHTSVTVGPNPPVGGAYDPRNPYGPVVIAPYDHHTIYTGTTRIWKSTDRGDHWRAISPVFSPDPPDSTAIMGITAPVPQSWGTTVRTLAVSALERGVLYAGTEDGVLAASTDDGATWRVQRTIPGVPVGATVTHIAPSSAVPGVAYASFSATILGDSRPYVFTTRDYGAHWAPLMADLPTDASVWVVVEHPRAPSLLFVGTDIGVLFTLDQGRHWQSLRNNMPAVSVRALIVQGAANDLIAATWGRGVFVLDDIGALVELSHHRSVDDVTLFPVRPVMQYEVKNFEAADVRRSSTPNPPRGALVDYYIPAGHAHAGGTFTVHDSAGQVVRRWATPLTPGLHRTVWDLRWDEVSQHLASAKLPIPPGALVRSGTYRISLTTDTAPARTRTDTNAPALATTRIRVLPDPRRARGDQDGEAAAQRQAQQLLVQLGAVIDTAEALLARTRSLDATQAGAPDSSPRRRQLRAVADTLHAILVEARGTGDITRDFYNSWPLSLVIPFEGGIYNDFPPPPPPLDVRRDILGRLEQLLEMQRARLRTVHALLSQHH